MSFKIAVQKKVDKPETTLDLFKEGGISRHEAAIAGISDLPVKKICRLLKTHPIWIAQTLYCKAIKQRLLKNAS